MDAAHLQRFAGIGRLYGRAGMERLARSSFLVVGLGGVGSWTVEAHEHLVRVEAGKEALVQRRADGRMDRAGAFGLAAAGEALRLSLSRPE